MSDLKPCPFCGEKAYEYFNSINCDNCCASMPTDDRWNKRQIEDELRAKLAAAEKVIELADEAVKFDYDGNNPNEAGELIDQAWYKLEIAIKEYRGE
jgi:hypothetical protein